MDDEDCTPAFCETHGKNVGHKFFRVAAGPLDL
jgi:hypothetical protein